MDHVLTACSCGLDPATESMAVQAVVAAGVSLPFWFRGQIANAVRRLLGRDGAAAGACAGAQEDGPPPD